MKTKWFSASIHKNYKQLQQDLVGHQFDENLGWGFQILKYSTDRLQIRYSEKVKVNEVITDPYGEKNIIEYHKYINFNFWLQKDVKGNHLLIIENPPRSIKTFIGNFIKCIESDFYISSKNINIESFAVSIGEYFSEVHFRKAKLKGLTFSKYTFGNLEVESSKDVLKDIKDFFSNPSYLLDKAKFQALHDDFPFCIEVTSGGTIIFDEEIFENIVKAVSIS